MNPTTANTEGTQKTVLVVLCVSVPLLYGETPIAQRR